MDLFKLVAVLLLFAFGCLLGLVGCNAAPQGIQNIKQIADIAADYQARTGTAIKLQGSVPLNANVWARQEFGAGSQGYISFWLDSGIRNVTTQPTEP